MLSHRIPENIPAEDPDLNWDRTPPEDLDEDAQYEILRQQEIDDAGELNKALRDIGAGLKMTEDHMQSRKDLLESIDVDLLIEYIDPDWRDHFLDLDLAYYHYSNPVLGLDPQKFINAITESGCKL